MGSRVPTSGVDLFYWLGDEGFVSHGHRALGKPAPFSMSNLRETKSTTSGLLVVDLVHSREGEW
jgi:hypothetical protein